MKRGALVALVLSAGALYIMFGAPASEVAIGKPAPAFKVAGLGGQTVSLSDYKGKTVLVNFWATWCVDCREEIPVLDALYKRHKASGFEIVAPSVDVDGRKAVVPFMAQFNPSYTVALADPRTAEAYGVRALPTTFLIGPDGVVIKKYLGALTAADTDDILKHLPLGKQP